MFFPTAQSPRMIIVPSMHLDWREKNNNIYYIPKQDRCGFFPIFISLCDMCNRRVNILSTDSKWSVTLLFWANAVLRQWRDQCLKCTCHHTWLYLNVPKNPLSSESWAVGAMMQKQMTVSRTFCVYLHDRGAKQSERSLHSHSASWCWNTSEWGKTERARVRVNRRFLRQDGRMRGPFCVFTCQLRTAHARVSARHCVCCRLSQSVCVQGVYLYKGIVGVLDLWGSQFKQREPPLFHPLIHVAVEAFSLKLNKRALDNSSRQSGSFVCALNLSATFLPFIPSFFHLCHFLSLSGPVPVCPSKFLPPPFRTCAQSLWLSRTCCVEMSDSFLLGR